MTAPIHRHRCDLWQALAADNGPEPVVFVDVGACYGYATRMAARMCAGRVQPTPLHVVAVEPCPQAWPSFAANMQALLSIQATHDSVSPGPSPAPAASDTSEGSLLRWGHRWQRSVGGQTVDVHRWESMAPNREVVVELWACAVADACRDGSLHGSDSMPGEASLFLPERQARRQRLRTCAEHGLAHLRSHWLQERLLPVGPAAADSSASERLCADLDELVRTTARCFDVDQQASAESMAESLQQGLQQLNPATVRRLGPASAAGASAAQVKPAAVCAGCRAQRRIRYGRGLALASRSRRFWTTPCRTAALIA